MKILWQFRAGRRGKGRPSQLRPSPSNHGESASKQDDSRRLTLLLKPPAPTKTKAQKAGESIATSSSISKCISTDLMPVAQPPPPLLPRERFVTPLYTASSGAAIDGSQRNAPRIAGNRMLSCCILCHFAEEKVVQGKGQGQGSERCRPRQAYL